jgi:Zn-dependent protease with chaperone function
MRFAVLGSALVLAAFLVVAATASVMVVLGYRSLRSHLLRSRPASRADLLFLLCLLPTATGLFVALGCVLPAWLLHEPVRTNENAGPALLVIALVAALIVAHALGRMLVEHRRTAREVAAWIRDGRPLSVPGVDLPTVRVEHAFPLAAIAGTARPHFIVAGQVLEALTASELRAVGAHERGHVASRDTLRRLLVRACPDPFAWTRARGRLVQDWEQAVEAAADYFAARLVPALDLASALVKVGSLVAPNTRLSLDLFAFERGGPLAARVRNLVAGSVEAPNQQTSWSNRSVPLLVAAAAAVVVSLPSAWPLVHHLLEWVVAALS